MADLPLVGNYLKALAPVQSQLDAALHIRAGVSYGDLCHAHQGLVVQDKGDFDAIKNFRGDATFKHALGIGLLPSTPTLRQRLDSNPVKMFDFAPATIETLLTSKRPEYGVLPSAWLALDVDPSAMDDSRPAKEGRGGACTGVDG